MIRTKTILIPLFKDLHLATDVTGGQLLRDVVSEEFKYLLPYTATLTFYTLMVGAPAAGTLFSWGMQLLSGFDRNHEVSALSLFTGSNTNGSIRQPVVTSSSTFQLESRLQIVYQASAAAIVSATISAVVAVETVGM